MSNTGRLINTKLLQSSPILEAFGNSKTTRNPNSSRFGKFMKIYFGEASPAHPERQIEGALIETYLLEKGRVIGQTVGEQNYHIFYQLLSNMDRLASYLPSTFFPSCESPSESVYRFLNPSPTPRETFREHFLETNYALEVIGYDSNEVHSVWKTLGAILLLGNIVFREVDTPEGAVAAIDDAAKLLCQNSCQLLGLSLQNVIDMLTQKRMTTRGETFTLRLTVNDAAYARDAFCKALYESLFTDIVSCINKGLTCSDPKDTVIRKCIGVLDVFGFESFIVNGYDQLLINFANEALQSAFNTQVFQSELKLFLEERIECPLDPSTCPDNTACIETIWSSKPGGISILTTLDSICRQPKPSDSKFCTQIHKDLGKEKQKHFPAPHPKDKHNTFLVKHFAGLVKYTVGSGAEDKLWVDRNNDSMPDSLWSVLAQSSSSLVKRLSENNPESVGQGSARKQLNKPTVAATFSKSIQNLTQKLQSTNCSFIRCIKPNPSMRPSEFDRKYVVDQMRALGLVQACEVMSVGLPNRISYIDLKLALEHITQEAESIFRDEPEEVLISALLMTCDVPSDSYRLGKTRVFFRPGHLATLEQKIRLVSHGERKEDMLNGMRRVKALRQTLLQSLAQIKNRLNDCESLKLAVRSQLEAFQQSLSSVPSPGSTTSVSILSSQVRSEIEEIQSTVQITKQTVEKAWYELREGKAEGSERQILIDQYDIINMKMKNLLIDLSQQEVAHALFDKSLRNSSQSSFGESALDRWQDISRLEELIRVARGLTKDAELAALRFQPQQTEERIQKCNAQYLAIQELAESIIATIQKDANQINENKNESSRLTDQAKSILKTLEILETSCGQLNQECSELLKSHQNLELKSAKDEADRRELERMQREAEEKAKIENERIQREKEEQLQQANLRRGSVRVTKFALAELSLPQPSPESSLHEVSAQISVDEIPPTISSRASIKFSKPIQEITASLEETRIVSVIKESESNTTPSLPPQEIDTWVLPEGWEEFYDASEGLPYYYNTMTQMTQWDRPEGPASSIGGDILPANDLGPIEETTTVNQIQPESVGDARDAIQSTESSLTSKCNLNYGRITTSQLDNLGTEVKTGYLMKRSGFMGRWKKKFFVLEGAVLSYYEKSLYYTYGSGGCKEMRLSINSSTSFTDTECTFIVKSPRLSSDEEISWMLIAENESSMREWVAFINAHIHSLHRKVAESEDILSLSARTPLTAQPTFWYLLPSCQNPVGVRTLPRTDGNLLESHNLV